MVLRDDLAQPPARVVEQQEALDQVQEAGWLAGRPEQCLQGHALRPFLLKALPRREGLEGCVGWTHQGFKAVGENSESVEVEQAWNGVAIVPKVVVVGFLNWFRQVLPFDQQQGNAVNEAHRIGPTLV